MLLEDFYKIKHIATADHITWCVSAELNPNHKLYQGHFPQHPIVPGVCLLQLIKECTETIQNTTLLYTQITSCKFLSAINPTENQNLEFTMTIKSTENGQIDLLAEGKAANNCFIKLKALAINK
ncbi:hotdog family protein [Bacteroides ihuae]|uniref:hydroxymyristoyl-ACP dehydratase n=1 Tax=Bacteroides ihuae TaxID=1852362 RepID=UPI0008DA1170|nr:hydroxymyristoyl-ACP dehydratase [Bacteroides ihuae]